MGRCGDEGLLGGELGDAEDMGLLSAARPEACCSGSLGGVGGRGCLARGEDGAARAQVSGGGFVAVGGCGAEEGGDGAGGAEDRRRVRELALLPVCLGAGAANRAGRRRWFADVDEDEDEDEEEDEECGFAERWRSSQVCSSGVMGAAGGWEEGLLDTLARATSGMGRRGVDKWALTAGDTTQTTAARDDAVISCQHGPWSVCNANVRQRSHDQVQAAAVRPVLITYIPEQRRADIQHRF
ncbi:uncharacterized protein MAM_01188 [Metarhizium album ARSEF 1941]|uniref:Uncharacterized protein n=1 Tax=Metarhizium album (strain ARSEF 1941) TaxID=1081103 RepID=A0A0B2X4N2_METAS|nr:uncharacterized protein MAM_01188 [Metarhizium album ARSEF 1941]KHO00410.1 hypothetical protein MAM_01188 [Metarhizium album ARSEF 1941]